MKFCKSFYKDSLKENSKNSFSKEIKKNSYNNNNNFQPKKRKKDLNYI